MLFVCFDVQTSSEEPLVISPLFAYNANSVVPGYQVNIGWEPLHGFIRLSIGRFCARGQDVLRLTETR